MKSVYKVVNLSSPGIEKELENMLNNDYTIVKELPTSKGTIIVMVVKVEK